MLLFVTASDGRKKSLVLKFRPVTMLRSISVVLFPLPLTLSGPLPSNDLLLLWLVRFDLAILVGEAGYTTISACRL